MGFLDWLGFAPLSTPVVPREARSQVGVLSPFQPQAELAPFIVGDIWGKDVVLPLTRMEALKIPSVAKARAILHSLIGSRPLVNLSGTEILRGTKAATWLYRSDTGISPQLRNKLILDDHLFCEASLLAVKRGAEDVILDAIHIPYDRWTVNEFGEILVDGNLAPVGSVVWLPGPWAGLLVHGEQTLRAARQMEDAWTARVRNPFPAMVVKDTADLNINEAARKKLVQQIAAARRDPDNAVFYLPSGLELDTHASESTDLFESGRNAIRLDIANLLNLPAALLDGSVSEASLTYSTQEGRRNELFDYTIPYWAGPIEEALSLDNVVPRGQRVRFDFTDLLTTTTAPTGPTTGD